MGTYACNFPRLLVCGFWSLPFGHTMWIQTPAPWNNLQGLLCCAPIPFSKVCPAARAGGSNSRLWPLTGLTWSTTLPHPCSGFCGHPAVSKPNRLRPVSFGKVSGPKSPVTTLYLTLALYTFVWSSRMAVSHSWPPGITNANSSPSSCDKGPIPQTFKYPRMGDECYCLSSETLP